MLIAIPLFGERVAPRCSIADSLLIVKMVDNNVIASNYIQLEDYSWVALLKCVVDRRIDTLVCGGISKENKKLALQKGIAVIDNVACSVSELHNAIANNQLQPGYGFSDNNSSASSFLSHDEVKDIPSDFNCLRCFAKECERGGKCPYLGSIDISSASESCYKMLDTALDISLEDERVLCRLSELIYYALEMNYRKIGIAYCVEMSEATDILNSVLRRFFEVNTVCCKVAGRALSEISEIDKPKIACNPLAQAEILNKLNSDFNIIVGLCIGTDCIFAKASNAPVTTLFVKDKSLANNPIGAIYSEYYLKEAENKILM